jgi:hypothetical protein
MESNYTFDETIVSDLHKDAYGFRPKSDFWSVWDRSNDDNKQRIWEDLCAYAKSEADRERQEQLAAEADLEKHFERMMRIANCTREDAIRYLHDAYDTQGSNEYLEYILGVRYGYLSGSLKVGY